MRVYHSHASPLPSLSYNLYNYHYIYHCHHFHYSFIGISLSYVDVSLLLMEWLGLAFLIDSPVLALTTLCLLQLAPSQDCCGVSLTVPSHG